VDRPSGGAKSPRIRQRPFSRHASPFDAEAVKVRQIAPAALRNVTPIRTSPEGLLASWVAQGAWTPREAFHLPFPSEETISVLELAR